MAESSALQDDKLFVAVPEGYGDGQANLSWVIEQAGDDTVVFVTHIVRITPMGDKSDKKEQQRELKKVHKQLDNYINQCSKYKIKAEKLVIENEDVATGLLELIATHCISKFVMGAAADEHYSREMIAPKSKKAIEVMEKANPSCQIWFVCKGRLIFLRERRESFSSDSPVKRLEDLYLKEVQVRKEIEVALAEEKQKTAKLKRELRLLQKKTDLFQSDLEENLAKLHKANEQKLLLEQHVAALDRTAKDLKDNLLARNSSFNLLQAEYKKIKCERNELRDQKRHMICCTHGTRSYKFSLEELQQATQNFNSSLKVGEGGFGPVYKGTLGSITVAIKRLSSQSLQGPSHFQQEVEILTKVRHPHLVTLVGACSEASALVYEFLPNGSLEDRLICKDNTPPLTWQVRTRIIGEICSALIFLHKNKPHPVVHGDLKPSNILLDANLVSKLSDFGISRLLIQSSTTNTSFHWTTNPAGTPAYMDPEFRDTGKLTLQSDTYSLGVTILRLLTRKIPANIAGVVQNALKNDCLQSIIDPSAGNWPFVQAKMLARIGVRCTDSIRRNRPRLEQEVWRVIEPLMKSASSSASPVSGSVIDESHVPSYFICPIFQEVMRDPHIAADGFTYEAEAIKGWFDSGHGTSPMTNLSLQNHKLIPNRALRSAIQEFFQQQGEELR